MDLSNTYDFYIDIDGDMKVSVMGQNMVCEYVDNNEKLDSHYFIATEFDTIKEMVNDINPDFDMDFEVFSQYAVKYDKQKNKRGVKIYTDCEDIRDNFVMVLLGYEIYPDRILKDYYFFGEMGTVKEYIKKHNINYTIQEFDTHQPILYSVKFQDNQIVDFKTYYVLNRMVRIYNPQFLEKTKLFFKIKPNPL